MGLTSQWMSQGPFRERRAPRYYFGGVVELTDFNSGQTTVALVRELSLFGCFIKTEMRVKQDGRVSLRISHLGNQFSATGRVVGFIETARGCGLGIEFTELASFDQVQLEACLCELATADSH